MASIEVSVPADLAEALNGAVGIAPARGRRSGTWQIMADVVAGATVTISLLQAPQTLADVASRLQSLLKRQTSKSRAIQLDAKGPGGEMRLTISDTTELSEITELLRNTIFHIEELTPVIWRNRTNNQTLDKYDSDSIDLLRRLSRVADTVEQKPLFASHLAYARELLQESRDQSGRSPASQPVQSTLAGQISHLYTIQLKRTELAAETEAQFASLQPFFDSAHLSTLRQSIDSHQIHLANTAAVTAVVRAVLMQIDHAARRADTIAPLFACASAPHNNGLPLAQIVDRLQQLDGLSNGYAAARKFYLAQWRKYSRRSAWPRCAPNGIHRKLRRRQTIGPSSQNRRTPRPVDPEPVDAPKVSGSTGRGSRPSRRHDQSRRTLIYPAAQESDLPDQAAAYRLTSEFGRLKSNQIRTPYYIRQSLIGFAPITSLSPNRSSLLMLYCQISSPRLSTFSYRIQIPMSHCRSPTSLATFTAGWRSTTDTQA